jgi:acetate kinase
MTDTQSSLPVLALNSGSSSLKFGLYAVGPATTEMLVSGEARSIGDSDGHPSFRTRDSTGRQLAEGGAPLHTDRDAVARIVRILADRKLPAPAVIGHRVVHGGPQLRRHCLINDSVLRQLHAASAFAPLHIPQALSMIGLAQEHFPRAPQIACFDTAFHVTLPELASRLPIPRELHVAGVQRYGFHGLSCESIVHQLGDRLPERLVIAHLGNGCSITAVQRGRSIDTSMGLTPTGGVIMGTRCGDLDPGVLVYLAREKRFDAAALEELVDHRSGLLGISELSSDMRRLNKAAPENANARLAIQMFCYSVRKQIAAMIAALDGIDLLVFTGGIGEHDAEVRTTICGGLSWVGISLDEARNRAAENPISTPASRCSVKVLAAEENEQIARHAWELAA